MLRAGLLMLLCALAAPITVFGQYAPPDPVPTTFNQCENPNADLKVGFFQRASQQFVIEDKKWINGPNNQYTVSLCQIASSPQAFWSLAAGDSDPRGYSMIATTVDNLINRQVHNMGNFSILAVLDHTPDQIVLGTNAVRTVEDLKGKNIATDSNSSGYVLQFRAVAAAHGLYKDARSNDYNYVQVGGTPTRYARIRAGNSTAGVRIDATIVGPPHSFTYETDSSFAGLNLVARVDNYVAPLTNVVLVVMPEFYKNPAKVAAAREYIKALLKGHAVIRNIDNRVYVENLLARTNEYTPSQATAAYNGLMNPVTGTITTVDEHLSLGRIQTLNVAYLRERMGGFDDSHTKLDALLTPGAGNLIDYTIRDSALPAFFAEKAIQTRVPASIANKCIYPALGQTYTVYNARAAVAASVSGGCSGAPKAVFAGCSASDNESAPEQCVYDADSDILRVIMKTPSLSSGRTYTASWTVSDICGESVTVQQNINVRALTNFNLAGCSRV